MVRREFHDKRRQLWFKQGIFQCNTGQHRHHNPQNIKTKDHQGSIFAEESSGEESVNTQAGTTGHKGRHRNRQQAIFLSIHSARSHHRRNVTAETHDQRHKGLPGQAYAAHQPVHNKSGACHVSGVFDNRQKQVEPGNHRNKSSH